MPGAGTGQAAHPVIPAQAGIQKGRARANTLPLSLPAKGARASEASTRGYARGGREGAGRRPSTTYADRNPHRPPSLQRKGDACKRSENAGGCPGRGGAGPPPHLVIPAQAGASADGTSIQKGRARANPPAPFAPSERGACKRSEHAGYARGGAAPGFPAPTVIPAQAGTHTVPLRSSVRGTRASGARPQGDARGGRATPSPIIPPPHLTFPQHMLYNNK